MFPLEQKYITISRQGSRVAPKKGKGKKPRSPLVKILFGLYVLLVIISAMIVGLYLVVNLVARPPEVVQPPVVEDPPSTSQEIGGQEDSSEDPGPPPLERREGVYNIFLAATDADGYRTDTMMVASYDVKQQRVSIVSIPRDTLIARSKGNPRLVYGPGGVENRRDEVSDMLGIPIDYYVKVNIRGFIALVDYLGGVDFYIPCDMNYDDPYQDLHIHYTEGMRHLNGQEAMEVARFRKNNPDENGNSTGYSDMGRTQTQQKLLVAMAKKALSWGSLTKINGFVELFNQYVDTDLSLEDMLYFASQAIHVDLSEDITTKTLAGRGDGKYRGYTYCFEVEPQAALETVNTMLNPFDRDLLPEELNLAKAEN